MMEHMTQNEESSQKAASSVSASPGGIHKQPLPLDDIRALVEACHRCDLCEGRTQVVFGAGNPHADVLIVGEAPGKNEDLQGEPFVGAAGKFLNELLDSANLKREDVFIANVIKCRPPGNRNPRADEIEACADFLREQTRTINPKVIVTLGNFATQFIMKTRIGGVITLLTLFSRIQIGINGLLDIQDRIRLTAVVSQELVFGNLVIAEMYLA